MADKKRKRDSHEYPQASRKKQAITLKHDKISVKVVPSSKDQLPPVLVVPSAIKVPELSLKPYARKLPQIPIGNQELFLHTSEHPRLDYVGNENFGTGSDALLDHYVGVYNPETGNLELHKARRIKLTSSLRPSQQQLDEINIQKTYQTVRIYSSCEN
jgi:DNA-directed RNA polymerase I subunit RPA49